MKTPAPITGGMNCPPVEAIASMAPASCGRKPVRFMSGMVKEPVVTTLATEEPEIEPNSAEVRTAILAGPPRQRPATAVPRFMKQNGRVSCRERGCQYVEILVVAVLLKKKKIAHKQSKN